ncbi:CHS1 [Mytilus coruscus]|uniref:chitin synthase n=1 Tax=Mytilus coruscus TaxID=42192 RepID=A0A6J8CEP4_MYTCO|nr:CHS1 [Mytilus coruscus]
MSTNEGSVSDLAKLLNLDNQEILQHLKDSFYEGRIYTYIGDVLIVVNPYETIQNLYNADQHVYYQQVARDPPHIFWTAEQSYRRLQVEQRNQCIVVTGDSGAGKTESTRHILQHLTKRSPCEITRLVEKLNHVNPLIELFGNARTLLNNNSSRFGKLIELTYNEDDKLIGGKLRTFVLEKSRVVHHKAQEKNFHIFHALFSGNYEHDLQEKYSLERPNEYRIMREDEEMLHLHTGIFGSQEEKQKYGNSYSQGCKILKEIEFTETEISEILSILAACLHLGNIEFDDVGDETDGVAIRDDDSLRYAIKLLGIEDDNCDDINEVFISRPICVQGQTTRKPLNQIQAADVRDSIVKSLYSGVFKAIIDQINKSIEGSTSSTRTSQKVIGILDISGFESVAENSLEQLFINITNERIHQYHQQQIFEIENKEYTNEGIHLPANTFNDNTSVLELIFGKPGVLSLLDDQIKVSNSDGSSLVAQYNTEFRDKYAVYQSTGHNMSFYIVHYAGQVKYSARDFLDKNRGTVPERIKEIFTERSDYYIVSEYFDAQDSFLTHRGYSREIMSKRQAREIGEKYNKTVKKSEDRQSRLTNSAASQYRTSLTCLVDILADARPLFVRCIKSNDNQQPNYFDEKVVLNQLQSAGIDDVTRIRRDGFQSRMQFDKFLKMCQIFRDCAIIPEGTNKKQTIENILQACKLDKDSYKIGRTKVFMKGHVVEKINKEKTELIQKRKEQTIKQEREKREREQTRQREIEQSHKDPLGTPNSQNNTTLYTKTDDIPMQHIPSTTIQDDTPETQSVNSFPPTYIDVENQNKRNENKRWAWDAFRNTERDFEGCVEVEEYFLKFCRFLMCFGLLVGIAAKGVATIIIPLLLASQLKTEKEDGQKSNALIELILCYSTPIALTFIQSMFKVCFGRAKNIGWKFFLPVLILESAEACGTAYLLFKVFCIHSMTSGITLVMSSFTLPSILNILKQIALARNRQKFVIRLSSVSIAVIAMLIQCGVVVCAIVRPNRVFSDTISNQIHYTTQEKICLVSSLVGISMGYCQNFLFCNLKIGPFNLKIKDWRIAVDKARPKINLKMCIIKVGIFLLMAKLLVPDIKWKFTEDIANLKDISLDKINENLNDTFLDTINENLNDTFLDKINENLNDTVLDKINENLKDTFHDTINENLNETFLDKILNILKHRKLMFIYIYCAIFASYESALACKLHMQRISFFIPLALVPLGCFGGVIGFCYNWPEDNNMFGLPVSCPSVDIESLSMWIGSSIGLWVSVLFLTWYVLFPQCHRMERDQRLFVLPIRDNFFSSLGLLMKRKDDTVEQQLLKHAKFKPVFNKGNADENELFVNGKSKESEERRKKKKKARPYIYICGTMWHETRQEMLQLLKSLFRLDFHRSKYKLAEKTFKVDVDYFEHEIHLIFDDAFETDKKSRQRLPNEWVKQLVECMEEASTSVARGRLQWDNKPTKTTTPYGGRLNWTMPGGTEMTIHLKDKDKIRHRKRWSQIMYMYYLLGYKMIGAILEDELLEKDTNKRYHYRRITSLLNQLPKDKVKRAHNSFILALDGDVDFKPEAVQKLIDKMTKNEKVGAVCGRIHPIGSGPVVWYQQFEYAVGHWLQKATEHVFGCVLCCPGAFSLFRASAVMDDNVMRMYTSPPTEARHFIQFEQGEDRWLCTLMLQQGWKIDYAASADAFTFAPQTFQEFFVQRRRWAPSTLANIIDLLSSWRVTTKVNDNISTLFVLYQFVILSSSLLGIGTVTLMITGSFNAVLKINMFHSYVVAVTPVVLYTIICMKCSNDKQIAAAALLSTVYTLVMVIVTVGLFVNLATEKSYSPNVIFFVEILSIFIIAGFAHPKELMCLVHGLLYYLMVPSTFIFLTVYYMCNIHVVTWGTREKKTEDDVIEETEPGNSTKSSQPPILIRCLQKLGVLALVKEATRLMRQILGARVEEQTHDNEIESGPLPPVGATPVPRAAIRRPKVRQEPDAWQSMEYLGLKEKVNIKDNETEFWRDILDKYLKPIVEDKQKKEEIQKELKTLRNNVAFGFLLMNFLFATAVFQLQNNEDQLKNFYILNEYEPLSVTFLVVFALVILLQFIGMLVHRWGTFLHLISSVRLWSFSKATEEAWAKQALKETETLQCADREVDYEETVSISAISYDSRVNGIDRPSSPEEHMPDYPSDEEPDQDYQRYDEQTSNEYERIFRRRFETIRKNLGPSRRFSTRTIQTHNTMINRTNLYQRTFGRHAGARINRAFNV